ncbi:hypothetical protein D3C71_2245830 [compost metagenome]
MHFEGIGISDQVFLTLVVAERRPTLERSLGSGDSLIKLLRGTSRRVCQYCTGCRIHDFE